MGGKLTNSKIKALNLPGKFGDGGTLFLRVAPGGSKQWIQRITINGKRRDIGLGGWPIISLAEARDKAFENRRSVAHGRDPLAEKKRAKVPSFREAAVRTYETLRPRWKNEKVARNWLQQLERHAMPTLADMPINRIGREEILRILAPIWSTRPETARRIRRYIRSVFSWSMAHGFVEGDPAGEKVSGALPTMPSVKENFRSLDYREIGEALELIEASGASMAAKLCFRFLILTAARSGEARGATWDEIDYEARTWTIPASRMKGGRAHRQPLSPEALRVLEQAREIADGKVIFPARSGRPLSDATLLKILKTTGLHEKTHVHGMRASFRTWASEQTNTPREIMELALAHQVGDRTEQAYARSDLFERRARLMQAWGNFVCGNKRGQVVELRRSG